MPAPSASQPPLHCMCVFSLSLLFLDPEWARSELNHNSFSRQGQAGKWGSGHLGRQERLKLHACLPFPAHKTAGTQKRQKYMPLASLPFLQGCTPTPRKTIQNIKTLHRHISPEGTKGRTKQAWRRRRRAGDANKNRKLYLQRTWLLREGRRGLWPSLSPPKAAAACVFLETNDAPALRALPHALTSTPLPGGGSKGPSRLWTAARALTASRAAFLPLHTMAAGCRRWHGTLALHLITMANVAFGGGSFGLVLSCIPCDLPLPSLLSHLSSLIIIIYISIYLSSIISMISG